MIRQIATRCATIVAIRKRRVKLTDEIVIALKAILGLDENYGIKILIDFVRGKGNQGN